MPGLHGIRWSSGVLLWTGFLLLNTAGIIAEPSTTSGPSGSTFTTAISWTGYQLAAFVDLNADRRMDVILLDATGQKLYASVSPPRQSIFSFSEPKSPSLPDPILLLDPGLDKPIRVVSPADFNGDSVADLLILTSGETSYDAYIAYGASGSKRGTFLKPFLLTTFSAQPLICDINSDLIADIYGEVSENARVLYYGGKNLTLETRAYTGPKWSSLGYSAFGDVNGDSVPDLLILVDQNHQPKIQVIQRSSQSISQFPDASRAQLIDLPQELLSNNQLTLGLFVLADFAMDGTISLILPACTAGCHDGSFLYDYNFKTNVWSPIDVKWEPSGISGDKKYRWSLTLTPHLPSGLAVSSLAGPTVGDLDLDGMADIGVGLTYYPDPNSQEAVGSLPAVLLNQGLNKNTGRYMFTAYLLPGSHLPENTTKVRQMAFFDSGERGSLDVFTSSINDQNVAAVQLFYQHMVNDFYFLKVTILNGLCSSAADCSDGRLPYGLTIPGLRSGYQTESADGRRVRSTGLLGVQSCCGALQVPFSFYGLGPFANYVEQVIASIPPNSTGVRSLSIPAVVPNCEVFVNPYPHDDPARWTPKLFLQPLYNMKVVYIAITLLCVCILLIVIISVLQWLEIREDRTEKQKEAQRFHFDAM
ncbi:T-cell immunomodulatory protein [Fasciolopsis buskii]|uniref:T-cell immunomodulatory protein n=1 Tax=Fasciolopsis buskii TaxID=27845 RepID=A0A8E0RNT0_9TREM|nr:T-cell immunomodulatory protein [Fasciolopsis buski]